MSIYPPQISDKFAEPKYAGKPDRPNGVGTAATFVCGSFVRFSIRTGHETKQVESARYQTNGCGFMVAASEIISEHVTGKTLGELHGFDDEQLRSVIEGTVGVVESGRKHCLEACFEAIHAAFADYRALQLEEFQGEKALICTCFGVTEERLEGVIRGLKDPSVEAVGDVCNAGMGCGSCRMLIEEMIDGKIG